MFDADDMALLRKYDREGSEAAFAELVRRHVNMVYSVACRRVGNAHDAEDVTQVVFTILAQKAGRLHGRTALTGWLYETTRFASSKFLRAKIRREAREQEAFMQSPPHDSEPEQAWRQLAPHLEEAMSSLGEKDRALVALRFFQYQSGAQAAAALGMREWAAHKRAARAVEKLRLFFARRGITVPAGVLIAAITAHSVQAAPSGLGPSVATAAAAKGIGAGAATSTLIKGTLKLMAWTKIKTAVVVGAGLLLAGGAATVIVEKSQARAAGPDESVWTMDPEQLPNLPPLLVVRRSRGLGGDAREVADRFRATMYPFEHLVATAYDFYDRSRMVFSTPPPPGKFDWIATVPNAREQLQEEIKRQFKITARRETRTANVFLLKVRIPNAPGLKPAAANGTETSTLMPGNLDDKSVTTGRLAGFLAGKLRVPVLDRTGLSGKYDINLSWDGLNETSDTLNAALQEQLGLELAPSQEPIEMLVVEKTKN